MATFFRATTDVAAEKTLMEIQSLLGRKGARQIRIDYMDNEPTGLAFTLEVNGQIIPFLMPARWERTLAAMKRNRVERRYLNAAQAKRTSWRVILMWLQAQIAFIETGQVSFAEIMTPFIQTKRGLLYEVLVENPQLLLEMKGD
jgi:hypothetical protein